MNPLPAKRNVAIDYFKSYLVTGMILAHTISLLSMPGSNFTYKVLHALAAAMNLVCFPGFFFCFGYVNYSSYFKKDYRAVRGKLAANAWRILLAYYISAFASAILISPGRFTLVRGTHILSFNEMPGYSEFLIAFFLIILLSLLFFNLVKKAIASNALLLGCILLSMLSSEMIPYGLIKNNQLGLLLGSADFTGFPLVPYLGYFLTGIFFAKNQTGYHWKILTGSAALFLPFLLYAAAFHHLPSRFPPDIFWLSGSAFPLYVCYLTALKSAHWFGTAGCWLTIGHHTLFYLLISNLLLFALVARLAGRLFTGGREILLAYLALMLLIYYLRKQVVCR